MSFVSEGTEEQVESAVSIALATHYGVPLSTLTVDATFQHRRLRTARELTSSKSWTVEYLIVADENAIDRVHDSATELSDAANAIALGSFADLLMTALSDEGVENSEPVRVSHTAPQKSVITVSMTTTEEEITTTMTEEYNEAMGAIVGTTVSVIVVLCALAYCFVRYRQWYRAREERQDMMISLDIPEVSPSEGGSNVASAVSPSVGSRNPRSMPRRPEAGSDAASRIVAL
jgi:hypothetical protein